MKNSQISSNRTALALVVVILAALAGCSSGEAPATGEGVEEASGAGAAGIGVPAPDVQVANKGAKPDEKKTGDRKGKKGSTETAEEETDKGKLKAGGKSGAKGGSGGSHRPETTSKFGGELQKPGGQPPGASGPVATVSRVKDAVPDADTRGDTPDFVEITQASITGHDDSAVFSISFAGEVPKKMPDGDTVTYVSFSLNRKGRNRSVNASCEADGWRANVNGGDSFPGDFSIQGKTISMSVPWKSLGGKKRFGWRADSSWTRSTTLDTHYALDSAPNYHDKRFR